MSSVMNIGVRALQVNQAALQTIGNNIANVNTPGYSRQSTSLVNVAGEFSGTAYYGKGVDIQSVQRSYSEFLTKQAAISKAVASGDATRYDSLRQLENVFQGGPDGLGASISNMLNAFSDITTAPTDLTARSVVLTRADEASARFRDTATQINDLKLGIAGQLQNDVDIINSLAEQIAKANDQIARATGTGRSPNDLLDQRDQMISQLNKYVQTTSIPAADGSVGIFLASSQPLVLGITTSPLKIVNDEFNDPAKKKLAITVGGSTNIIDESTLGGGEMAGLLRFQNNDLIDASNLLGRMALAIGTRMNEQQALGLDLNGIQGSALFNLRAVPDGFPSKANTGNATVTVGVQTSTNGTSSFVASDYELSFSSGTAGTITRLSDGVVTAFDLAVTTPLAIDGLDIQISAGAAAAGDRFLLKPFSASASSITTAFSSPRGLAMSSAVAAGAGLSNIGTLTLDSLSTVSLPAPAAVTLNFTGPGTYTRSDTGATVYTYTPGQAIDYSTAPPLTGWALVLKGVPQAGDTYTVQPNPFPSLNADNARSMLDLRDLNMFDGGPLTDGYASLMADIGTKVQSARSASAVSTDIATNTEKERAGISGVNLDEEAAKMLQFQQAYQAAGKVMKVAQDIFDTLLQSLGR